MSDYVELTTQEKQQLAARGWSDPVWFCEYFLKDLFPTPMPWFHRGVLAILLRRCDFLENDPELSRIIDNFYWRDEPEAEVDDRRKRHYIFKRGENGLEMKLNRFTLLMMPRGFSKTTIAGVAVQIFSIVYQDTPTGMAKEFLDFLQSTEAQAIISEFGAIPVTE